MMAPALSIGEGFQARDQTWLEMVGRLRPGVSIAAAQKRLDVLARRLEREYPASERGVGYDLRPAKGFEDSMRGAAIGFFAVLGALAAVVLGVACINVTGILLARALAREKEIGVRLALGAGRERLVRLFVTETLLLFAAGGAAGALLTTLTTPLLQKFRLPLPVPLAFDFSPGPRVVAFALLAAAAGGILFGLIVALPATRPSASLLLRSGAATERRSASRLRSIFVALQVAACVLLLVTSGLFLRTVEHASRVDPGFDPEGLVMTQVDLSMLGYDAVKARAFYDELIERVRQVPGVAAAAVAGVVPLGPGERTDVVALPGRTGREDQVPVDLTDVGETYFATMRIPILKGRPFESRDVPGSPPAAIVNETLAKMLWPGRDPLGQTLFKGERALTVVGVARDGKYRRPWEAPRAYLYLSSRQQERARENLVVRATGDREALAAAIRREIHRLEPALPLSAVIPVREHMGFSMLPQRVAAALAGALGAIGLTLASVGLAGLVAYSVSRRRREIGVRMALGAAPGDILTLEMARGVRVAVAGLAAGTLATAAATRLIAGMLFGVTALDPLTFGAVLALLAVLTLASSYLPARRAARLSPMDGLRSE